MEMAPAKNFYEGTPCVALYIAQMLVVCAIQKLAQSLSLFSFFFITESKKLAFSAHR